MHLLFKSFIYQNKVQYFDLLENSKSVMLWYTGTHGVVMQLYRTPHLLFSTSLQVDQSPGSMNCYVTSVQKYTVTHINTINGIVIL